MVRVFYQYYADDKDGDATWLRGHIVLIMNRIFSEYSARSIETQSKQLRMRFFERDNQEIDIELKCRLQSYDVNFIQVSFSDKGTFDAFLNWLSNVYKDREGSS